MQPVSDLVADLPPSERLTRADARALADAFAEYHAHFAPLFARREQRQWADVYWRGLLGAEVPRKNVEAMALRVLGAGPGAERRVRAVQQFIGEGAWDDAPILAEHQRLVEQTLGEDDGVLILDGSDFPQHGTHSVGVAPQWCGATGNGQRASRTSAQRACFWRLPAAGGRPCSTGDCICRTSGAVRRIVPGGRRVAFRRARRFAPSTSWRRSWWRRCGPGSTDARGGESALQGRATRPRG
jgi:DDE superfamily endonuclease